MTRKLIGLVGILALLAGAVTAFTGRWESMIALAIFVAILVYGVTTD